MREKLEAQIELLDYANEENTEQIKLKLCNRLIYLEAQLQEYEKDTQHSSNPS